MRYTDIITTYKKFEDALNLTDLELTLTTQLQLLDENGTTCFLMYEMDNTNDIYLESIKYGLNPNVAKDLRDQLSYLEFSLSHNKYGTLIMVDYIANISFSDIKDIPVKFQQQNFKVLIRITLKDNT